MNNNVVSRLNSSKISKAVGNYTHITKIEPNATFYTFSGQVGANLDGNFPVEFNKQVNNTFLNISNLLKSIDLTPNNVIKINIWATEEIDWDYFDKYMMIFWEALSFNDCCLCKCFRTKRDKIRN